MPTVRVILLSLLISAPILAHLKTASAQSAEASIRPPTWQAGDQELAKRWEHLTGRHIYQVACTSCHEWGSAYWPRKRWVDYLEGFPGNHEPDVRKEYADLTAMFDVGRAVPNSAQQRDALSAFILSAAPKDELPAGERDKLFEMSPLPGDPAPRFSIHDMNGAPFNLDDLKGKKALVLIFSRAHW